MNGSYKPEGKYDTSPNEKIETSWNWKLRSHRSMIALDKIRNFYTCACKTNFVVEGSKNSTNNIFQKTKKVKKNI